MVAAVKQLSAQEVDWLRQLLVLFVDAAWDGLLGEEGGVGGRMEERGTQGRLCVLTECYQQTDVSNTVQQRL